MAMEDPGWGGYVPGPEEDEGRQPPGGGKGSGSQPPGDTRPWWRRTIVLVVAATVAVLVVVGVTVKALSNDGPPPVPPTPSPIVDTTSIGPSPTGTESSGPGSASPSVAVTHSAADAYAAFVAQANAICRGYTQKLTDDYNNGSGSLSPDTQDLVNALKQLGSPPSYHDSWKLALEDWQQAADFADTLGPQDWLVNIKPGGDEFNNAGVQDCSAIGAIGQ
jgi:hypothetical protein